MRLLKMLLMLILTLEHGAHVADDPHTHFDEHGFVTLDTRNYAAATCSAYVVVLGR